MTELFLSAFVSLFVVIDPPGCAPIYAGLSANAPRRQAVSMAARACAIAGIILVVFALFGEDLLGALHIELDAFRIAGGIMLFMIALDMVFERRTQRREERAQSIEGTPQAEDISVFPMAIPMIAGPGSIATIMLLTARSEGMTEWLVVFAAMTLVILLTLAALLAAGPLMRLIGAGLEAMITRILGVILAALAVQFILDGLERSLPGLAG